MAGNFWGMPELKILGMLCGEEVRHPITGYAAAAEAGLGISTVYAILGRFEQHGYVRGYLENVDPRLSQRAPRTLFSGTTVGADQLNAIRALVGVAA